MDNMKAKKKAKTQQNRRGKWSRFIPRWLSLPLVIIVAFLLVMLFYGDNSYLKSREYREQIDALSKEIKVTRDSAAMYQRKLQDLYTDKETLEKIAREQYGMKRANEDVYLTDIK